MTQSKVKQHFKNASNMSFTDIVSGSTKLVGKTISLGFKTIGATVYVGNKALDATLQVGKAAYNESKKGYQQTDNLMSPNDDEPKKPMAVKREPQQMEFDFDIE